MPTPFSPALTDLRDVRRAGGYRRAGPTSAAPATGDQSHRLGPGGRGHLDLRVRSTPADDTVQSTFGNVHLAGDVLIHLYNNKKGAGLLALFNEAAGKAGLALVVYDSGGSDSLVAGHGEQSVRAPSRR